MKVDTIVKNNLKRFRVNGKSDWNHVVYDENHYLCPNKFYDDTCMIIFENRYFNNYRKDMKRNIYKKRSRVRNMIKGNR